MRSPTVTFSRSPYTINPPALDAGRTPPPCSLAVLKAATSADTKLACYKNCRSEAVHRPVEHNDGNALARYRQSWPRPIVPQAEPLTIQRHASPMRIVYGL